MQEKTGSSERTEGSLGVELSDFEVVSMLRHKALRSFSKSVRKAQGMNCLASLNTELLSGVVAICASGLQVDE